MRVIIKGDAAINTWVCSNESSYRQKNVMGYAAIIRREYSNKSKAMHQ